MDSQKEGTQMGLVRLECISASRKGLSVGCLSGSTLKWIPCLSAHKGNIINVKHIYKLWRIKKEKKQQSLGVWNLSISMSHKENSTMSLNAPGEVQSPLLPSWLWALPRASGTHCPGVGWPVCCWLSSSHACLSADNSVCWNGSCQGIRYCVRYFTKR